MEAASSGLIWLLLTQIINALAQISVPSTRFPACWTAEVFTTLIFLFLLLAIGCQHPSRNSTSLLTTPFTWQAWISAARLNRRGKQRVNSSERGPVARTRCGASDSTSLCRTWKGWKGFAASAQQGRRGRDPAIQTLSGMKEGEAAGWKTPALTPFTTFPPLPPPQQIRLVGDFCVRPNQQVLMVHSHK